MPYRRDPDSLYDLNNGYKKDELGSIYNSEGFRLSESPQAVQLREQAEAEREAARQAEHQMIREAWNKTGGLSFLNPFHGMKGLFDFSGGLAAIIIKLWLFLFVFMMIFMLVIAPIWEAVDSGIRSVKSFFSALGRGIKAGAAFLWDKVMWFFTAWIEVVKLIFSDMAGFGFFRRLLIRGISVFEIFITVSYLVYLWNRYTSGKQPPMLFASNLYEPSLFILASEFILWLLIGSPSWTFLSMIFNALCLCFWVIAAELVITQIYKKKLGFI